MPATRRDNTGGASGTLAGATLGLAITSGRLSLDVAGSKRLAAPNSAVSEGTLVLCRGSLRL